MNEAVIALVCDFDETLGPDTISYLLKKNNISYSEFWPEVYKLVKQSWDPPLAYMFLMLQYAQQGKLDLSEKALQEAGRILPLYSGLPEAFMQLKRYVKKEPLLKDAKMKVEFYIISGGLEAMIKATPLGEIADGVFGSTFAYDKKGQAIGVKSAISFTEKTRFLFGIHKGFTEKQLRETPYKVNDTMASNNRKIPFSHMVYVGDGPSDIPCLSVISQYGGTGIGVVAPKGTFKRGYELARGNRLTVGPYTANYKQSSDMRKILEETILQIGLEIRINQKKKA